MHNLAAKEPERVKEMVAKWETWAKRANVLPWPWEPAYGEKAVAAKGKKGKGKKGGE
jgi:arylsulfatase